MSVSERARDFWDRISPRERGLVALGVIAAPIVIAIWIGLAISDGLTEREAHNDKMRKALAVLADLRARGPQQPVNDVLAGMPADLISLDTYLTNSATAAGFVLKGTTPRTPVSRNGFVTGSVTLTVSDLTLDQLKKFLQDIETKSKFVAVTHLEISRRDYKGKDKLDASLEVSTYATEAKKTDAGSGSSGSSAGGSAGKGG